MWVFLGGEPFWLKADIARGGGLVTIREAQAAPGSARVFRTAEERHEPWLDVPLLFGTRRQAVAKLGRRPNEVAKGSCFLRNAAVASSSPTTSARQRAKPPAPGGAPVSRTFVQATQSLNKLVAKFNDPSKKQLEDEVKKLRQELLAAKAGGAGSDEKEPKANEDDAELDQARKYIRQFTGVPCAEVPPAKFEARVVDLVARKRGAKTVPNQLKDLEGAIEEGIREGQGIPCGFAR